MGGFHIGIPAAEEDSIKLIRSAIDAGINFMDNCWDYHDGTSELRMGKALQDGYRKKVFLMTKIDGRTKAAAAKQIDQCLLRLRTDVIDLVQYHEMLRMEDADRVFGEHGAHEAMEEAKKAGKVRFVGFTGHKDPSIHLRVLAHDFPFDTVQMPLNCLDATFRSFERQVLPEASRRGIAVLGMKSLGGGGEIVKCGAATPAEALRYAMSLPVATTISGVDSPAVLEQNLAVACGFVPMSPEEMQALRERCRPLAADGRGELFKTTKLYDAAVGRAQHHFPSPEELPL
jgi:predicted aldo/keto reductase-like oxidoreductase